MPRSSFGKQYRSKLPSEPALTFATHGRETRAKLFVSYEHSALDACGADSPGPGKVILPASVGKQVETHKPGTPSARFTGDRRFREPDKRDPKVGPQSYNMPQVVFRTTALSRIRSEPKIDFGRMDREKLAKATEPRFGRDSPGPAYAQPSTLRLSKMSHASRSFPNLTTMGGASPGPTYLLPNLGPGGSSSSSQLTTKYRRAYTPKIGSSTREQREKMFPGREIHAEMEKAMIGVEGPGPQAGYKLAPVTFGKQVTSKFATRPKSAFGRASRFGVYEKQLEHNRTPGPGAYEY